MGVLGAGRWGEEMGGEGRGGGAPNQPTTTKSKRKTRATRPVAGWCYFGDGKGGEGGRHDLLHERSQTVNPAPRPRCLGQETTRWGSGGAVSPPVGCGAAPSPTTGAGAKRSTPSPHTIHRFWTYPLPTLLLTQSKATPGRAIAITYTVFVNQENSALPNLALTLTLTLTLALTLTLT